MLMNVGFLKLFFCFDCNFALWPIVTLFSVSSNVVNNGQAVLDENKDILDDADDIREAMKMRKGSANSLLNVETMNKMSETGLGRRNSIGSNISALDLA